ncbi:schwannomin-interacting protein 1 [Boleophthalmus pectinirostris]|uniref:schwannomin-interacting protein 1 n=1 Tax=Boleophthalmus pectinirostris TaxID=150288 RepID=UPI000A1C44E6|nr:schwannomin-interacting protein 1 [Boleophthalmus pectinirostris]
MEVEGEKERLQRDEKEYNEAETDRTSDEEEEEDSEGATLLWQEGYNEDNEGLPIMHWEALSLRIAELEKQEEERREKNAKAGGSPDNSWMEDRGTRAENWDYEDDACNSHVMALTSRLQTQMNLQLCFINNSESEEEEEKEEGSSKKDATNNKESAQSQKNPPQPTAKSDKSSKSKSKSAKSEKPKSSRGFRNTLRNLRDRLRTDHRTSSTAVKDAVIERRHLERTDLQNFSIKELNKVSTSLKQTIQDLSSELVGLLQIRDQLRTEQDAMLLEVQDLTAV